MSYYEYRVVPAPKVVPRIKGVTGTENLFSLGLEDALNAEGQDAWEYQRSETMTVSAKQGFFRKTVTETVTVLIYRRWVEAVDIDAQNSAHNAVPDGAVADREPPETPESQASNLRDGRGDGRTVPAKVAGGDGTAAERPRLSASRRPEGDLRPVPGTARD